MKTVGIIGGLGPQTTSEFYLKLGILCDEANMTTRPRILIESVPLPLYVEKDVIVNGLGVDRCLPYLLRAAKSLQDARADFLVMPCNSLHIFIEEIRSSVEIPVLSIVEETVSYLTRQSLDNVGVISTAITLENKLYENALTNHGITVIKPDGLQQAKLGVAVHHLVDGRYSDEDRKLLNATIETMASSGVKHVLLACTDLQLLLPSNDGVVVHDTMQILVESTARNIAESNYTGSMTDYEQQLLDIGIEFEVIEHPEMVEPTAVMEYLGISPAETIPTLIMKANDEYVVILRRGDKRLDYKKLRTAIAKNIRMATPDEFEKLTGLPVGAARVYNLSLPMYIDKSVMESDDLFGGSGSFTRTVRYKTASLANVQGSRVADFCL